MDDYLNDDENDEPSAPFWMVTFSDMVTILLTFFVMIVAMSEVEIQKFQEALSYFQGHVSVLQHESVQTNMRIQTMTKFRTKEQAQRYEDLLDYLKSNDLHEKIQVNLKENGIHLVITDSVMFHSGDAELIEPSRTILRLVAGLLDAGGIESVVVEGHTDDRPINTIRFPSNWELSTSRAASVVRFLTQETTTLAPSLFIAIGHGEFHPVDTNDTPEGRALNRRVEILFSWKSWEEETNNLYQTPLPPL